MCKRQLRHGANTGFSYTTHAFLHGRRLGVIPLKRAALRQLEFVVEVVVHVSERDLTHPISPEATVVELGICSGTMRQLSWYLGSLDLPILVLVTAVVQGPRATWVPVL